MTNWPRAKLKYVASLSYGSSLPHDPPPEGIFRVYGSNGPFSSYSKANTQGPAIIVGRKGSYGKVNWSEKPCFASDTTFFIDGSTTRNNLRWVYWLLQTLHLDEGSDEAAVPGLNRDTAYSKDVFLPPIHKQRAIADYLDRETARIDAMIETKEHLLALLAEKRQSFITRAVTHGLDQNVAMRHSGIPWLREIPAHWEVERARWLFRERDERSETGTEDLLTVSHITGVTLRSEKEVTMFEAETKEGYKRCSTGDLVINTMWAWMGAMGVAGTDGIVSPAYNVYQPLDKLEPNYVDTIVRLPLFSQEVKRYSKGVWSSRLRLYPEGFFEVFLPVPPVSEQREIVRVIAIESRKIADLTSAAERTISLLKERCSALIAAAVTGLIDVGIAA